MKAYRQENGKVVLFRPEKNAQRMQASAARLCMQAPNTELFIQAISTLLTHI